MLELPAVLLESARTPVAVLPLASRVAKERATAGGRVESTDSIAKQCIKTGGCVLLLAILLRRANAPLAVLLVPVAIAKKRSKTSGGVVVGGGVANGAVLAPIGRVSEAAGSVANERASTVCRAVAAGSVALERR